MNKERKNQIQQAVNLSVEAKDILDDVRQDEQDALDNTPENLQSSDRYYENESAIEALDDAIENLDSNGG
ncbi:MAG: hypothetical protein ACOYJC_06455 [Christensenellales bacterium]|jgi:ribosome recycling factor